MTDVDLEFSRVRAVLDRPTLRLMSRPTSAAVIAVFRTVFDRDVQYVPADRMHLQVEEHVARLQATGARVPASDQAEGDVDARPNGRALCRDWVAAQWLVTRVTTSLPGGRRFLNAEPTLVLADGEIVESALSEVRLTEGEIMQAVRSSGQGGFDAIAAVVLEPDGSLSVIPRSAVGDARALAEVPRWPG